MRALARSTSVGFTDITIRVTLEDSRLERVSFITGGRVASGFIREFNFRGRGDRFAGGVLVERREHLVDAAAAVANVVLQGTGRQWMVRRQQKLDLLSGAKLRDRCLAPFRVGRVVLRNGYERQFGIVPRRRGMQILQCVDVTTVPEMQAGRPDPLQARVEIPQRSEQKRETVIAEVPINLIWPLNFSMWISMAML